MSHIVSIDKKRVEIYGDGYPWHQLQFFTFFSSHKLQYEGVCNGLEQC